jgi:hypothetical protein
MPTASKLPINTSATANDMAEAMFGNGITVVSASYTGAAGASGIYSDGDSTSPELTPSDTGVILSTGNAVDVTNATGDVNALDWKSTNHGTSGDSDLSSVSGQATYDAAVFEAEFVPQGSILTMQIVFSSEEYLEYVNSGFNDAVGIWVNGVQAELTVGTGDISIDNINTGSNENLYLDNARSEDTYNTEMDGFTVTLTLKAPVNAGANNTIKIGIADGGDGVYDSNLLIAGDSVQTALVAGDDDISVRIGQEVDVDVLANDQSASGGLLTITHINGQPVVVGDTITLPSGEMIELSENGIVLATANIEAAENVFTYTVQDENGNSDIGFVTLTTTPCFTPGTYISTPEGDRLIDTLSPGDLVETLDNGPKALLWVGRSERYVAVNEAPIKISKGTLGAKKDTSVSPLHRILIRDANAMLLYGSDEVFVAAKNLVNGDTICCSESAQKITYFHLLFENHEIILGDGVLSESFHPGKETRESFDPALNSALEDVVEQYNLKGMRSARPTLKGYEAGLLKATPKEDRFVRV